MQCFCEPKLQTIPTTCAEDGGDCLCNGHVYYMKKMGAKSEPEDFYNAMKLAYTV